MKDVLNEILKKYPSLSGLNIKEAFILNNELYITSEYEIDNDTFQKLEQELINI